ncbi:MAG TPA: hypothetical protein VHA82_06150 [Ramlibacter sp.]|uniref:hypothetical protein n=1 Tax=Ramlibacter sp. TaxID=1917967 RepID=UPI002C6BAE6E|nr:hypothetical protein [Ramlibacter sp.]HVZ43375.1 hypothetical protein [Ramlibacter sp.]
MHDKPQRRRSETSEFLEALGKGALIGLAAIAIALPAMRVWKQHREALRAPAPTIAQQANEEPRRSAPQAVAPQLPAPPAVARPPEPPRLADFGGERLSPETTLVANWSAYTRDHGKRAFVIIDKKQAHAYVFDPQDRLIRGAPVLLGKARGDDSAPDIGTRPLSLVKEYEKTTPAGRFIAEPGVNSHGEHIVWVSYDLAVSMHRVRKVKESEHRFARLASPTIADNRISFGCINMPFEFFDNVLEPTVKKYGAVVYVLPDVKSIRQVFGAYDVTQPSMQLANYTRSR